MTPVWQYVLLWWHDLLAELCRSLAERSIGCQPKWHAPRINYYASGRRCPWNWHPWQCLGGFEVLQFFFQRCWCSIRCLLSSFFLRKHLRKFSSFGSLKRFWMPPLVQEALRWLLQMLQKPEPPIGASWMHSMLVEGAEKLAPVRHHQRLDHSSSMKL